MKRLFTLLFSISLIQAAIANPSHQHPMPTDPKAFALMQETLTAIHAKVPAKSIDIEAISKKARVRHEALLKEWQTHLQGSKLKYNSTLNFEQMLKLQDVTPRMNFLDVQTSDALVMLVSVQTAAQETLSLLQELNSQALAAANGAVSSDELARMNRQFQALIQLFPYFQSIYTINGPKLLSGGNVHLQFGKESRADAVYDIKIPAFTVAALGLNNLSLDSQINAMYAVNAIYEAEQTVNAVLMNTGTGYLTDAQTMVYELGLMLQSHFTILGAMQTLSMEAAQYVCVGGMSEHPLFNVEADYLKALMQKNQSYLSLNGVVNEGYGDLTIQIGSEVSPKTTLTLQIPVTNASMTGMSDLQLDDCELALAALRQTNAVMTAFAYGAKA